MPSQKALLLPAKQAAFVVGEIDVPTPGPGQLLVKIQSTALNPVDWNIQKFGILVERFPARLGLDAAGTVEALGEGVTGFTKGDRVFYERDWALEHGTFQQYGLSNAVVTAKIPSQISFDQAASIPLGLATAAIGLYHPTSKDESVNLTPPWEAAGRGKYAGKPFLVFGGASSVGQYVIQLARLSGFSPIIATASLHNTNLLTSLGATHVVGRTLSPDALRAEVAKITTLPIEAVYDAISDASTQNVAYSLVAPGGTLALVSRQAPLVEQKTADRRIIHVFGSVDREDNLALGESLFAALPSLLEKGDLKPNLVEVVPGGLQGIPAGLDRMQKNLISGLKLIAHPQE